MRRLFPALFLAAWLSVACPASAREPLGQFAAWGAFRDAGQCYVIAEPAKRRAGGWIALSSSPARGVRIQFHARLSRAAREDKAAIVRTGAATIPLVTHGQDAWAADARTDLRIVAAIRRGGSLVVSAVDPRGRRFTDRYVLAGAPSAIDAALIGCIAP